MSEISQFSGKTPEFPPVSTSFHQFPRPQLPGHRLIWRHHGRRRKGGCHKFRGHGEGSSRFDPVVWCCFCWLCAFIRCLWCWCRFCLVGCVVSFLCVGLLWLWKLSICLLGEIALGRTWFCIFMEIRLESVMPSAFYIDPWQSWVSSMATFLTLEPQTSSRATGPTQDTPHKKLFSSVFGKKMTPMTNQITVYSIMASASGWLDPLVSNHSSMSAKPRACTSLYMSLSLYIFYQSSVHPPLRYFLIRPTPPFFCPKNRASHPQLQTTCSFPPSKPPKSCFPLEGPWHH